MAVSAIQGSGTSSEDIRFDYLKLLVTQLRNQNPLEPMDNSEMASQLSQFASLEQLEGMNSTFGKVLAATQVSQAATLVGKLISYYSAEDGSVLAGRVEHAEFENGEVRLMVDGSAIGLAEVLAVGNAPAPVAANGTDDSSDSDTQAAVSGDYNGDGVVDIGDLAGLANNYGRTGAGADFNGDGVTDVHDLAILANNYGRGAAGGV